MPADNRDWGANQIPVLVDHEADGSTQKRMLWANRNGFYYVFDRSTGAFLRGTRFVQATWTSGLDARGRPLPPPANDNAKDGQMLYPGAAGGTHWSSPTYYPPRDLMIVPVVEQGMVYFHGVNTPPQSTGRSFYTAVRALDAGTGEKVWEFRRPPRSVDNFMPGLLSTAGGLVFGSDQSTFFALDAETGALLWSVETGGNVRASPMTYAVAGEQYVSIAAGSDFLVFGLPKRPAAPFESGTAEQQ